MNHKETFYSARRLKFCGLITSICGNFIVVIGKKPINDFKKFAINQINQFNIIFCAKQKHFSIIIELYSNRMEQVAIILLIVLTITKLNVKMYDFSNSSITNLLDTKHMQF